MRESVALIRRYQDYPKFNFGLVRVVYENRGAPQSPRFSIGLPGTHLFRPGSNPASV